MPQAKHRTRTVKEMRKVIADQEASGKTLKDFCKDTGIGIWILSYWRKRLKSLDRETSSPSFAEVKITSKPPEKRTSHRTEFKVQIGDTFEVSVPSSFDGPSLKSLVEVLKSC